MTKVDKVGKKNIGGQKLITELELPTGQVTRVGGTTYDLLHTCILGNYGLGFLTYNIQNKRKLLCSESKKMLKTIID